MKIKNVFYLQKNDRQALTVLLIVGIVCITLLYFMSSKAPTAANGQQEEEQSHTRQSSNSKKKKGPLYYKVDGATHELFAFDPNTADSTALLRLGLQPWQVRNIYHYRAKGGIYRKPSDFARLYGLTKKQYEILRPYIIIGEDYKPAADFYGNEPSDYGKHNTNGNQTTAELSSNGTVKDEKVYSYPQKLRPGQTIAVNGADTTELKKIPGIGSSYAARIVRYREQLGGYVSKSQLTEIEGFPETALPYIQIDASAEVKKLKVNKLSFNQLRKHPYLNYYQAREICDYRRMNGPLKSLKELSLLKDFPPAEIERLTPYVSFE